MNPEVARDHIRAAQEQIDRAEVQLELALDALGRRPPVTPKRVLALSDLHYLGKAGLPLDVAGQTRFGYSTGAIAVRVVNGVAHVFITGAQADTGWMDPIYEVAFHGAGTRCTLVGNYGDVTCGKRISASGNAKPLHGLLYDNATRQLLSMYMDQYNVNGSWDPCLIASTLDPVTAAGPWRLGEHSQKVGGYLVGLPEWLTLILGGRRFAAGAPIGSGNYNCAYGAFLAAFNLPPADTPPDTADNTDHITIPTTCVIYTDFDHRQPRDPDADECGWTYYGERDSQGAEPQWNPTQNGTGCTVNGELCGCSHAPLTRFGAMDAISGAAWIDTPTTHGLVMIGQLARTMAAHMAEYGDRQRCDVWYGPPQVYGEKKLSPYGQNDTRYGPKATGPGCTTMQSSLYVYDPAVLAKAAAGIWSPIALPPAIDAADPSTITHDGAPFPQLANAMATYGGATYAAELGLLFISECHAEWQGEWRPVLHAFRVKTAAR
jgi:hypothetical protein